VSTPTPLTSIFPKEYLLPPLNNVLGVRAFVGPRGGDVQIDWTRIPRTKLRRPDMLESAIADGLAGAHYLASKFPNVPLILGGFSFGGPTVWAVARRLQAERPGLVGGLVAMAGSARGGELYEEMGVDTAASVRAVSAAGVPVQFVHGTHDKNVALQVAEFLYKVRGHVARQTLPSP